MEMHLMSYIASVFKNTVPLHRCSYGVDFVILLDFEFLFIYCYVLKNYWWWLVNEKRASIQP